MAMNMTYIDPALKDFYGVAMQEQLNNEIKLFERVQKSSIKYSGRRVIYPTHYGRNASGWGARADEAALPCASQQLIEEVYVTAAYNYMRLKISGPAMAAAGKNSFVTALGIEMEKGKEDLKFDLSRQCYGDGIGTLARCEAANTATQCNIYLRNDFKAPGNHGARYLIAGQSITIGNDRSAADAVATANSGAKIESIAGISVNSATLYDEIIVSGSINTSASSFIYNLGGGGRGPEIKGLRAIIDDTTQSTAWGRTGGYYATSTIFNIDRDSVSGWNSHVTQNCGTVRVLDSYGLQRFESQIKKKSGKDIDLYVAEYDTIDAFFDSVRNDRRFLTKNFDAGVDTLTFNGKTFLKDLHAPYSELFGICNAALKWYELAPLQFDNSDGVLKNVAGYDVVEAFMKIYTQLAPGEGAAPNSCGVFREIKTRL